MLRADGTLASGFLQDARSTHPVGSWLRRDGVVGVVLIGGDEGRLSAGLVPIKGILGFI